MGVGCGRGTGVSSVFAGTNLYSSLLFRVSSGTQRTQMVYGSSHVAVWPIVSNCLYFLFDLQGGKGETPSNSPGACSDAPAR